MAAASSWVTGVFAGWALTFAASCEAGTLNARILKADDAPVAGAVVSVTPVGQGASAAKPGTKAVMAQENRQFSPFVLPVQVGTTVEFPNHDPFRHQVYSFSRAKSFELKLYGSSEVGSVTFDKEGAVPLGCNIHDNMLAYVYVVGTPYFALTDNSGQTRIPQLPAGTYVMKSWHPSQKAGDGPEQTLKVAADGTVDVTLRMEMKRERRQRKPGAVDERDY